MDRRTFLRRGVLALGGTSASTVLGRAPVAWAAGQPGFSIVRSTRPTVTNGVQSGDVSYERGVVWARTDQVSRLVLDVSTTESMSNSTRYLGQVATPDSDYTAKAFLTDLTPGQRYTYSASFELLDSPGVFSEPVVGSFTTPGREAAPVRFAWTGDCAGQGWGINPEWGGMPCWESMRLAEPQFLIHSGDTVYADGPLKETVTLPNGTVWRNLVTPEKSKVAETLDEFRGNFRYNLLDDNVRRFCAEVPLFVQWDDHEVTNNWYPGDILNDKPAYTEKNADVLAARALQAFHEYFPTSKSANEFGGIFRKISWGPLLDVFVVDMRTFRGPNTLNVQETASDETNFLGEMQLQWLLYGLTHSTATWKVIAADMPIGLVVPDNQADKSVWYEAIANDDAGPPKGRELEFAWLLSQLKRRGVANVVWLTADVHYCAAHYYDPAVAQFTDFDPFWEFVSGPVHAGTFGPNDLDATFGPTVVFQKVATYPNMAPIEGYQFFGTVDIDPVTKVFAVELVDVNRTVLFRKELPPA